MTTEQHWEPGTPERVVADAFAAFRDRDVARFAGTATNASVRAVAARVMPGLDEVASDTQASATEEMTDGGAEAILGRAMALLPEHFTDMVRCVIVGRVLESRIFGPNPDGRGMICLECRVTGARDEWVRIDSPWHSDGAARAGADDVAHVVFYAAFDFPDKGVVPFPPERQIATTQRIGGEWKLVLDEESMFGLPGFRGLGFWIDAAPTSDVTDNA